MGVERAGIHRGRTDEYFHRIISAMKTFLMVGYGRLGAAVLDQLAPRFPDWRFVVVSRNKVAAELRLNLSRYVWSQWGIYPHVAYHSVNLHDTERMANLITECHADLVFNATTPFPWWRIDEIPPALAKVASDAGPGMWAAADIVLPQLLAQALALAGSKASFINACYPDMTNTFLSGTDGAPLLGIGNISNIIPGMRLAYAAEWRVEPQSVVVKCVGHHSTSLNGPSTDDETPAPYFLEVASGERQLLIEGPSPGPFQVLRRHALRQRGVEGQAVTVGSASTVLAALMGSTGGSFHAPGALGLPGGYPVTIDELGRVELDLPSTVSKEQAVSVMVRAQRFDGTQYVESGVVEPTEKSLAAQEQILGFVTERVTTENVADYAANTVSELNRRYGLELEAL